MNKFKKLLLYTIPADSIGNYRKTYKNIRNFYNKAQWWSKERIEQWQLAKLQEIIRYAYENTSGYNQLYRQAGVCPEDLVTLDDIKKFPFIDKSLMKNNLNDFVSKTIDKRNLRFSNTSGSTGSPFVYYNTKQSLSAQSAFVNIKDESIGIKPFDKRVLFKGYFVDSADNLIKKSGFRHYELSLYHLTDDTYPQYKKILVKLNPSVIFTYPSAITELAEKVIHHNDTNEITFNYIVLSSENFYPWQKKTIQNAFPDAKIMCHYGQGEQVIWAPWCEKEETYHINPFYGFTEILGENNREVNAGQIGELVGTSFWMNGTPFIRYKTGDYARKGNFGCSKCGRQFQLIESIEGRKNEVIIGKTGRKVFMTALVDYTEANKIFDLVKQCRFVQYEVGKLELLIIPKTSLNEKEVKQMKNHIEKALGEDFFLEIKSVEYLSRSKAGKFSFLEQHLKINNTDIIEY